MVFKSFHDNPVNVLHFPGSQKITNRPAIDKLKEYPVTCPDDITIISIMTPDLVPLSPIHYQLTKSGIAYINTVPENHKMWLNKDKAGYIVEALKEVTTPYALILDGNDTVIVDGLDDLVYKFNGYGKDIIFNATQNRFPDIEIDQIDNIDGHWGVSRAIFFGPFCHLNAGVCLGKADALRWFYEEVKEAASKENIPSEQYYVRRIFGKHQDTVFFDYDCRLFQAFNKGMMLHFEEDNPEELNIGGA